MTRPEKNDLQPEEHPSTSRLDFSLTQLLYFVTTVETGSISETATRLHASQSAVSAAIQRLERHLGSQLLLRQHARGVTPTRDGLLLLRDARKILRLAHNLKDRSSRLRGESAGCLDVGSCCTITPFLIPKTLARLGESHPGLRVNVHDTRAPGDLLRNGVCDIVVTYSFSSSDGTRFTELIAPPLYAVVPGDHPLAGAGRAQLVELCKEPLLTLDLPPHSGHHAYVKSIFLCAGVAMPRLIHASGQEAMRSLVGAGAGFMLTHHRPRSTETLDGGRVSVVEIVGDRPRLTIGVQILTDVEPNQRMRDFVTAIRSTAKQVYAPGPGSLAETNRSPEASLS
ncbi:LysR family transcriptional regulator [Streptomyces sp. NPDC054841]